MKNLFTLFLFLVLCPFRSAAQQLPEAPQPHRFLDRTNLSLISASAVTLAGDGLSTQAFMAFDNRGDINPIARPFVGSRKGDALYFGAAFAAEVGGMVWLHRHGHHRIERILPMVVIGVEAYTSIDNFHFARQLRSAR